MMASNASNSSTVSNASSDSNINGSPSSSSQSGSEYDNVNVDHEVRDIADHPQDGGANIFPTSRAIKEQQRIPAHLNASDEELYLFLRNPPSPPVPFYPSSVRFAANQFDAKKTKKSKKSGISGLKTSRSGSSPRKESAHSLNRKRQHHKRRQSALSTKTSSRLSPQKKQNGKISRVKRTPPRKSAKSKAKHSYFAAPQRVDEVTISYPMNHSDDRNGFKRSNMKDHSHNAKVTVTEPNITTIISNEVMNESLSISDENHVKCTDKESGLSPKTMASSMAAIKDAQNTSLLDHVDLTTSQTLSGADDHELEVDDVD